MILRLIQALERIAHVLETLDERERMKVQHALIVHAEVTRACGQIDTMMAATSELARRVDAHIAECAVHFGHLTTH